MNASLFDISPSNIELIEQFIANLGVDKSSNTVSSYENDLDLLLRFLITEKTNFINCTPHHLTKYFSQYYIKDKYNFIKIIEATTVRRKISCFRAFFGYLLENNFTNKSPIEEIEIPKKSHHLPFYLSQEETRSLFDYTESLNKKDGIRLNAILHILYSSGVRISEAITIKLSDVLTLENDIKKKIIILGKGNKERTIFFDKKTQLAIIKYISIRQQFKPHKNNDYLFCSSSKSGYISRQNIFIGLQKVAYFANLPERLSPHKLRHSFATHMYQNGIDLRMLQVLLGHSDISTTEIYTHIKADQISQTVEKFHPLFKAN